jgi:hypothetical protein
MQQHPGSFPPWQAAFFCLPQPLRRAADLKREKRRMKKGLIL